MESAGQAKEVIEWQVFFSERAQREYYFNPKTKIVTWILPDEYHPANNSRGTTTTTTTTKNMHDVIVGKIDNTGMMKGTTREVTGKTTRTAKERKGQKWIPYTLSSNTSTLILLVLSASANLFLYKLHYVEQQQLQQESACVGTGVFDCSMPSMSPPPVEIFTKDEPSIEMESLPQEQQQSMKFRDHKSDDDRDMQQVAKTLLEGVTTTEHEKTAQEMGVNKPNHDQALSTTAAPQDGLMKHKQSSAFFQGLTQAQQASFEPEKVLIQNETCLDRFGAAIIKPKKSRQLSLPPLFRKVQVSVEGFLRRWRSKRKRKLQENAV